MSEAHAREMGAKDAQAAADRAELTALRTAYADAQDTYGRKASDLAAELDRTRRRAEAAEEALARSRTLHAFDARLLGDELNSHDLSADTQLTAAAARLASSLEEREALQRRYEQRISDLQATQRSRTEALRKKLASLGLDYDSIVPPNAQRSNPHPLPTHDCCLSRVRVRARASA